MPRPGDRNNCLWCVVARSYQRPLGQGAERQGSAATVPSLHVAKSGAQSRSRRITPVGSRRERRHGGAARHRVGSGAGYDIVPLVGARRRESLSEALGAFAITLTTADLARIEAAVPSGAGAGERYAPPSMQDLDSERDS